MADILSDQVIETLIKENKPLPSDFYQAISCLIKDCGFEIPADIQKSLFEEI